SAGGGADNTPLGLLLGLPTDLGIGSGAGDLYGPLGAVTQPVNQLVAKSGVELVVLNTTSAATNLVGGLGSPPTTTTTQPYAPTQTSSTQTTGSPSTSTASTSTTTVAQGTSSASTGTSTDAGTTDPLDAVFTGLGKSTGLKIL